MRLSQNFKGDEIELLTAISPAQSEKVHARANLNLDPYRGYDLSKIGANYRKFLSLSLFFTSFGSRQNFSN